MRLRSRLRSYLELLLPPTIRGERLSLRSVRCHLTEAEAEEVYSWSRDHEILKWSGGAPSELTLDEFRDGLRRQRWRPESNQRLFYIVNRAGELIGRLGLYSIDWQNQNGEFGISIAPKHWGQRYGGAAVRLFTRYVFSKMPLERITLGTFQDNIRAQRAFASCGFRVIGTTRRFAPLDGRERDGIEMELTRQDLDVGRETTMQRFTSEAVRKHGQE